VAVVFDDDAFFPALTVEEHLAIVSAGHGVEDVEEVIASELEFFGLKALATSRPYNLSSGQRRRMLLASAFVRPRSLLVLDEPEQRLDTAMRHRLATRLRAEVDAGLALLVVTHDPEFLTTVATKALFIADTVHPMTPAQAAALIHIPRGRLDGPTSCSTCIRRTARPARRRDGAAPSPRRSERSGQGQHSTGAAIDDLEAGLAGIEPA